MAITLTTDFGYTDPFVGILRGVILGIHPNAQIIDFTHGIPAQDTRAAALVLNSSFRYFPQGTIHVVVVDPGVGTERRPILIQSQGHYFIGPDNGVLTLSFDEKKPTRIVHLSNEAYHLHPKSRTFHGRDIFAPVAAHLSHGVSVDAFGAELEDCVRISWPRINRAGQSIRGEILYIDGFGNLFTNIRERDLRDVATETIRVSLGSLDIRGLSPNYAAGKKGNYVALINSWGLVEIALYRNSAASHSHAKIGDQVQIECGFRSRVQ
ncbi:MAG: hypothetical protein GEU77_05480 [Deltaproteobacteria bacterium]|nr:hypothetical protein [Deltaproteobacteria bacterium]